MTNDVRELADALHRFSDKLDNMERANATTNTASARVDNGALGIWICATACLVMLACSIFMAVLLVDHSRRLSDLDAYLSAIYMQAPHLKPADDKEK